MTHLIKLSLGIVIATTIAGCGINSSFAAQSRPQSNIQKPLAVPPEVAITSPPVGSFITTANDTDFMLSGTCNEDGQPVVITGPAPITATTTCTNDAWSVTLDVSFIDDGTLTFTANMSDSMGNAAPTATYMIVKDTVPPFGNSIVINGGASPATSDAATLTLASMGASFMYVTNSPTCNTGGTLQPYATTLPWTLAPVGNVATVYAYFQDEAGNKSACVSASVIVSITPPTPSVTITTPTPGSTINAALAAAFALSGTCSENGQPVVISGAASASVTCSNNQWMVVLNLTSVPDGTITFYANTMSAGGVAAPQASASYLKDTAAPTSNSILINGGAATTTSTAVTLTLNSTDATEMYITNTAGCMSGGTLVPYSTTMPWTLEQTSGTATVYASFENSVGNVSSCVSASIVVNMQVILPLTIVPSQVSLTSGQAQSVSFSASGGTPPYVFSIVSGQGTIQPSTGAYTATASATGTTIVKVTDSKGLTATATITYTAPTTTDTFLGTDGTIFAIAVDRDGNRYIGGEFDRVILKDQSSHDRDSHRGYLVHNLVKVKPNGTIDYDFLKQFKGTDGAVQAISISGQDIYIGGNFDQASKAKANHIAKINPTGQIDLTFSPQRGPNGTDRPVETLAATANDVFVGGEFNTYRSHAARSLVKLSSSGVADSEFGTDWENTNGPVYALALNSSETVLYVGGDFTEIRGARITNLANINASTGRVNTGFNSGDLADVVYAIGVDPNGLGIYVSGNIKNCQYDNKHENGYEKEQEDKYELVRLTLNGKLDQTFPAAKVNGTIRTIAVDTTGTRIYVGGTFSTLNGETVNKIALLNQDGALSSAFSPSHGPAGVSGSEQYWATSAVYAAVVETNDVLIGGSFSSYRGMTAYDYAELGLDGTFDF